jgi:hypothetical protein
MSPKAQYRAVPPILRRTVTMHSKMSKMQEPPPTSSASAREKIALGRQSANPSQQIQTVPGVSPLGVRTYRQRRRASASATPYPEELHKSTLGRS